MIGKYARFILRYRAAVIPLVLLITLALWYPLLKQKMREGKAPIVVETSVERMTLEDDEALAHYREFSKDFGSEEYLFIVFKTEHMFEPETLAMIQRITEWLERFEYSYTDDQGNKRTKHIIDSVLSITNAKRMVGSAGMLEIEPIMPQIPKTKDEALRAKKLLLENPFYVNNIISSDGTTTGIVAYVVNIPNDQYYRTVLVNRTREYLDEQFYEYSIENGYSVLRISEKYSMHDNKVISPKPKYRGFLQHLESYKAHAGLSLLYMHLYGFKMQPYEFVGEPRVILHFYITGGD